MSDADEKQNKQAGKNAEEKPDGEKIPFGNFMQGISNFIDFVSQMEEEGKEEARREGEFSSPSGRAKASFGISVRTGIGELSAGNAVPGNAAPGHAAPGHTAHTIKKPPRQPSRTEEERQPFIDVFDEQDHILLIIDLPGVEEKHIHTEVRGDTLILSDSENQKFSREVALPPDVDTSTMHKTYKNGVLEIKMSKK